MAKFPDLQPSAYKALEAMLGIGHPGSRELVEPYVLQNFEADELEWMKPLIEAMTEAFPLLVADDTNGFATKVAAILHPNAKNPPPVEG